MERCRVGLEMFEVGGMGRPVAVNSEFAEDVSFGVALLFGPPVSASLPGDDHSASASRPDEASAAVSAPEESSAADVASRPDRSYACVDGSCVTTEGPGFGFGSQFGDRDLLEL